MKSNKTIFGTVAVIAALTIGLIVNVAGAQNETARDKDLSFFLRDKVYLNLNAASPSGSRSVSSSDNIIVFDVCAGRVDRELGSIDLKFQSDNDFNQPTNTSLKVDGSTVGQSRDGSVYTINIAFDGTYGLEVEANTCRTVDVYVNSYELIDADSGIDDPVQVSIEKVYGTDGKVLNRTGLSGNVIRY